MGIRFVTASPGSCTLGRPRQSPTARNAPVSQRGGPLRAPPRAPRKHRPRHPGTLRAIVRHPGVVACGTMGSAREHPEQLPRPRERNRKLRRRVSYVRRVRRRKSDWTSRPRVQEVCVAARKGPCPGPRSCELAESRGSREDPRTSARTRKRKFARLTKPLSSGGTAQVVDLEKRDSSPPGDRVRAGSGP